MALFSHVENNFCSVTLEYAHGAGRAAMVVNRASLSTAPAKHQRMICRTGMHQISPITLGRKLREWQEVCALNAESCQAVLQNGQRNTLRKFIQLCEPLLKRQVHALLLSCTQSVAEGNGMSKRSAGLVSLPAHSRKKSDRISGI